MRALGGSAHDYLQYVLAGIIVQNALFTTLNRALPIARFAPLGGRILPDLAKQAWAIALLFAVGSIMGFRAGTGPLAVLALRRRGRGSRPARPPACSG